MSQNQRAENKRTQAYSQQSYFQLANQSWYVENLKASQFIRGKFKSPHKSIPEKDFLLINSFARQNDLVSLPFFVHFGGTGMVTVIRTKR